MSIISDAQHNRVPCLMALEERLDLHPEAVLRDYAYGSLIAVTVVVLDSE